VDELPVPLKLHYSIVISAVGLAVLALCSFAMLPWWENDPLWLLAQLMANIL
jgi:hypothetical protein